MKSYEAIVSNLNKDIIGIVTKVKQPVYKRRKKIFVGKGNGNNFAYRAAIIPINDIGNVSLHTKNETVLLKKELTDEISNGDIIKISQDGIISQLWDTSSNQNSILVTERCNCNCRMCPQPPKNDDASLREINSQLLSLLNPNDTKDICLTGGEPTIDQNYFLELIRIIIKKLPHARISVLTNAKQFHNFKFAKNVAASGKGRTLFCVSLQADTDDIHDDIVGSSGSFAKTIKGIHNLAKLYQKIEIRFVINKLNYARIPEFSKFISRNFPFVVHVAFMGMEIIGNASNNYKDIWVDPNEYMDNLSLAVDVLVKRGIWTSIYNIPLCLLEKKLHRFSRKSISTWKNQYHDICDRCYYKSKCCGFFSTSEIEYNNIKPYIANT